MPRGDWLEQKVKRSPAVFIGCRRISPSSQQQSDKCNWIVESTGSVKRSPHTGMTIDVADVLGEPLFKFLSFLRVQLGHVCEKICNPFTYTFCRVGNPRNWVLKTFQVKIRETTEDLHITRKSSRMICGKISGIGEEKTNLIRYLRNKIIGPLRIDCDLPFANSELL